jgi:PcfJ-like protein
MLQRGQTVFLDLEYMEDIQQQLTPILDWLQQVYTTPRDLSSIAYSDAIKKSEEWHHGRERLLHRQQGDERRRLEVSSLAGTHIMFKISFKLNGEDQEWLLCNLISPESLKYEGNRLHHCVGDGYYWDLIKNNHAMIWALRKSLMEPNLTLTVNKSFVSGQGNGTVIAMLGLLNRRVTRIESSVLKKLFEDLKINIGLFSEFFMDTPSTQSTDKIESVKYELVGNLPPGF